MKTKIIKSKIKVQLTMTEEQAIWLHAVMVKPVFREHSSDESTHDAQMRRTFFEATKLDTD